MKTFEDYGAINGICEVEEAHDVRQYCGHKPKESEEIIRLYDAINGICEVEEAHDVRKYCGNKPKESEEITSG